MCNSLKYKIKFTELLLFAAFNLKMKYKDE